MGHTWFPIFNNKKTTHTEDSGTELEKIIVAAVKYDTLNKLVNKVRATVDLTAEDCSAWNLPKKLATGGGSGTHTTNTQTASMDRTAPTMELVYAKLIPQVGGFVHIEGFTAITKSGRPHKLKGFDLLEYAFGVFYSGIKGLPTKATDPRLTIRHSTKASTVLSTIDIVDNLPTPTPDPEPAKVLVIFFRWAKSKHPNLDGPWSVAYTTVLL